MRKKETIDLDETIKRFLLTGEAERGTPGWDLMVSHFFDDTQDEIEKAWEAHKEPLMAEWEAQGCEGEPFGVVFMRNPNKALYGAGKYANK